MLAEIDWMSINVQVAEIIGISLQHFNLMEVEMLSALNFDIGIPSERFKARLSQIDRLCQETYSADVSIVASSAHETQKALEKSPCDVAKRPVEARSVTCGKTQSVSDEYVSNSGSELDSLDTKASSAKSALFAS